MVGEIFNAKAQRRKDNKQLSRIYIIDIINDYNDITIKTIKDYIRKFKA